MSCLWKGCGLMVVSLSVAAMCCAAELVDGPATSAPAGADRAAASTSFREAVAAIDLRTFPMLKHGEVFYQSARRVGYAMADSDLNGAMNFYREKLGAAGWKLGKIELLPDQHFGSLEATRQGFQLNVSIVKDPRSGAMHAFVENYGNVDARLLPRYAGVEPEQTYFHSAHFRTKDGIDPVARDLFKRCKALGWLPYTSHGGRTGNVEGKVWYMRFVRGAINLNIQVTAEEGYTGIMYGVSLLNYGAPIPPDVTETIDLTEDPTLRLFFTTKLSPADVLDFYRRELPPMGWKIGAGPTPAENGETHTALTGPAGEKLVLKMLEKDKLTAVQIAAARKDS